MVDVSPIYVTSKGRALTASTPRLLDDAGLPYTIVVEPQEERAYRDAFPRAAGFMVLGDFGRGLPYVRNAVLDDAPGWFWMLDDDISGFWRRENGNTIRCGAEEALRSSEQIVKSVPNVGQGGLEYKQFAWSSTADYALNSYCDVCVLINKAKLPLCRFREDLPLKVDREFTLQVLCSGHSTVRVQRYAFSAPGNGTNIGGLQELYQREGQERQESLVLASLYPGFVRAISKKSGRPDAKINWRAFKGGHLWS